MDSWVYPRCRRVCASLLLVPGTRRLAERLVTRFDGISRAAKKVVHATFFQKVILCALAGFAAACLIQWGKVFVEGADKALNGGYEHRTSDPLASHK